jgi:hypothetical protein
VEGVAKPHHIDATQTSDKKFDATSCFDSYPTTVLYMLLYSYIKSTFLKEAKPNELGLGSFFLLTSSDLNWYKTDWKK